MVNETKEKEIWKQYPKYPWIKASNLGRVRTKNRTITDKKGRKRFVKGHILKQYLLPCGYMYVTFSVNGKTVNLRVNRVVAICFLPNPDNLPEVNHIDCDPTNNRLDNLEWCTSQYNSAYRDKLGHGVNNNPGHPVYAVNLKNGRVLRFESQHEAARQLGVSVGHVTAVVKGERNQTGEYWFTENRNEITEKKIREVKAKMVFLGGVVAVNLDTFDIFYFETQHEVARQFGVSVGNLNMVLKGQRNKTGGCWFCYADEDAVEKTRSKFGDKIAEKVEELMSERKTI